MSKATEDSEISANGKIVPLRIEQDRFGFMELLDMLKAKTRLDQGTYRIDVSNDGTCKFNRVKTYWIQKSELIHEGE